jgi:hypothetical protein
VRERTCFLLAARGPVRGGEGFPILSVSIVDVIVKRRSRRRSEGKGRRRKEYLERMTAYMRCRCDVSVQVQARRRFEIVYYTPQKSLYQIRSSPDCEARAVSALPSRNLPLTAQVVLGLVIPSVFDFFGLTLTMLMNRNVLPLGPGVRLYSATLSSA